MKKVLLIGLVLLGMAAKAEAAGVEVYSEQLQGCVEWDNVPTGNWFYLKHAGDKLSGGCDYYNNAKWFQNGPGLNAFVAQNLRRYEASYGFVKELGRAWINISKDSSYQKNSGAFADKDLFSFNTGRFQVAGLSYDAANDTIVLNGKVMATVKHGTGFLGLPTTEIVGAKPTLNIVDKTVDDGFSWQYESPFAVVTLE